MQIYYHVPGTKYVKFEDSFPFVVSTRMSYVHPGSIEHSLCSSIGIGSLGNNISVVF